MPLQPRDVQRLDERAQAVGVKIGWPLRFVEAPNPEYVGLMAQPGNIIIFGPRKLDDLTAHEIEFELDALERGERQILLDDDGDPRLI